MSDKQRRDRRGSFSKGNPHRKPYVPREPREPRGDQPKDRNYFLKYVQSVWYSQADELPALNSEELIKDDNQILKLKEEAKALYEKLAEEYEVGTCSATLLRCKDLTGSLLKRRRRLH